MALSIHRSAIKHRPTRLLDSLSGVQDRAYLTALIGGELAAVCLEVVSLGLWSTFASAVVIVGLAFLALRSPLSGGMRFEVKAEARKLAEMYAWTAEDVKKLFTDLTEYSYAMFDAEVRFRCGEVDPKRSPRQYSRIEVSALRPVYSETGATQWRSGSSDGVLELHTFSRRGSSGLYVIVRNTSAGSNCLDAVMNYPSRVVVFDRYGESAFDLVGVLNEHAGSGTVERYLFENTNRYEEPDK